MSGLDLHALIARTCSESPESALSVDKRLEPQDQYIKS